VRRAAAHVFVEDLTAPKLTSSDLHHLSRVLRLQRGETVSASDGLGGRRLFEWSGLALLQPLDDQVSYEASPSPFLTVAVALTKGERPEWAVQKLTESGVDRVVLMTTARTVVRWQAGAAEARPLEAGPVAPSRQVARLREVARQAAMQSRRAWLPSVEGPVTFTDLVRSIGTMEGAGAAGLAVAGGRPPSLSTPTLLIGPEGGWSEEELAAVPDHIGLGPHVLRAETAAVAAGVLLSALRSGLINPGQG